MTMLLHALEHVSAFIGIVVLLLIGWGWTKLRHYRTSKAEKDAAYRAVQQTRPWWPDEEEKPHVR